MALSFLFFKRLCLIVTTLFFVFDYPIKGDQNVNFNYKRKNKVANLDWNLDKNESKVKQLRWQIDEKFYPEYKLLKHSNISSSKSINVKAIGRAVTINGNAYPEISNYVPNAFVEDWQKTITLSTRAISKIRSCNGKNFSEKCIDGIVDLDLNLINTENFSFNPKITFQSLTNRSTAVGEGTSLGFKMAKILNKSWALSVGGENIIHLDDKSDLGRNYYIVGSTFYKLNESENPAVIFLNAGIGSDYYGFQGNGFLFRSPCLGSPNLTGEDNNQCSWGPIASVSIALNDRFAFNNEWFGYSYGTGISLRPFKKNTLNFSIYATDYIKGLPSYASDYCHKSECETRYYGSLSFTF